MESPWEKLASLTMVADHTEPWNPDRRWADPLIALLCLAILCLLAWRMHADRRLPLRAPERVSAQARLIELRQAAKALAQSRLGGLLPAEPLAKSAAVAESSWDRALIAILAVEDGDPQLGRSLAMDGSFPGGEAFRRCYSAAYLSRGAVPDPLDRAAVGRALRNGYAAHLLEARLQTLNDPLTAHKISDEARSWAIPRLAGLAVAGSILITVIPAGIAFAILLAFSLKDPRTFPIPVIQLSGRALALAFLGWFLVFLSSGLVVGTLVAGMPALRPFSLPLIYGFHATVGISILCRVEGISVSVLRRRLLPGSHLKSLAWGLGFLAVAVVMVLVVSLALGPFLRPQESPQRELMDLVAGIQGFLPLGLLFLTVSVAAPLFEECLFRGTLLPWLGYRLEKRMGVRPGWTCALVLSSLGFGLIHLQPVALPVLSTLGFALGLAFLHTRNLGTAILVHGVWNGGVFLFYRLVLG
jgi:membrane protease YdiL (CAAX protease family)